MCFILPISYNTHYEVLPIPYANDWALSFLLSRSQILKYLPFFLFFPENVCLTVCFAISVNIRIAFFVPPQQIPVFGCCNDGLGLTNAFDLHADKSFRGRVQGIGNQP